MKKIWRYLIQQSLLMVLLLLLMTVYSATLFAAQTPGFSATASGATNNLTLAANISIGDADAGKSGNYYLGFNFDQKWYFHDGIGWAPFDGGAVPIYAVAPLASRTIEVLRNANVSALAGAQLYVGYGLSTSDMLANGKYAMVYTVAGNAATAPQPPVLLGTAGNYAVLAKTAVSTVPASVITGDVGVSPAATTFLTGFSLTMVGTTSATSAQVTGSLYGADMTAPTSSNLTTAVSDMEAAYTDAAGRPTPDYLNLGVGEIGGLTLAPGLYKWTSGVTISSNVTLSGGSNDVWIFQIPGNLTISAAQNVALAGGAKARNIYWQVTGAVEIGTNAHFEGIILSQTAIGLRAGASMNGRALAQSAVALETCTVTNPAP